MFMTFLLRLNAVKLVEMLYRGALARNAGPAESVSDVQAVKAEGDLAPVLKRLVEGDEHWHRSLDAHADEVVRAAYLALLGREPEAAALAHHGATLARTHDLASLLAEICRADEHWNRLFAAHAPQIIQAVYRGLLARSGEPAGVEANARALVRPGDLAGVLAAFVRSDEYIARARREPWARPASERGGAFSASDLLDEKLVFLHLPKTGGTSLHHALVEHFPLEAVCPERFNGLRHYAAGDLAHYRFFSGHFDLPSVRLIPGRKKVFTFLREPVARLVSLYYFERAHGAEIINRENLELARMATQYSMADFFRAEEVRTHFAVNNAVARALTVGIPDGRWEAAATVPAHASDVSVDAAFAELMALDGFGIMERFDESAAHIYGCLGLPAPAAIRKRQVLDVLVNENPDLHPIEKEPVTDEVRELIENVAEVDIALYRKAVQLFDTRVGGQAG